MLIWVLIWLENLPWFSSLRSSAYVYPIVLALHLTAISLFAGAIVATDLRLLGWTLSNSPIADLMRRLRMAKIIGFAVAAGCGFLLFATKAEEYYYNPFFRTKMILFALVAVHALAFRESAYGHLDGVPAWRTKLAGSLSLALWLGILCAGRAIGYVAGRPGMHYR